MKVKIEPFVNGFMNSLKAQMDAVDREIFSLIFSAHQTSRFASPEEKNPAKAAYYFRFGESHLNVLLPIWLLNGKQATKADRFRIACTFDHSFILDTRDSILYDPTTEILHMLFELKPLWQSADWKDETALRFRDELMGKRLKVHCFHERLEHMPALYERFCQFVMRQRLKNRLPQLRFGLQLADAQNAAEREGRKQEQLVELALEELWSRHQGRSQVA